MLSWVCSLIDRRSCKKVVRTSVVHPDVPCMPLFCSNHITDITCDLFMNRRTAVKLILRCSKLVPIRCQTKNIRKGRRKVKGDGSDPLRIIPAMVKLTYRFHVAIDLLTNMTDDIKM